MVAYTGMVRLREVTFEVKPWIKSPLITDSTIPFKQGDTVKFEAITAIEHEPQDESDVAITNTGPRQIGGAYGGHEVKVEGVADAFNEFQMYAQEQIFADRRFESAIFHGKRTVVDNDTEIDETWNLGRGTCTRSGSDDLKGEHTTSATFKAKLDKVLGRYQVIIPK